MNLLKTINHNFTKDFFEKGMFIKFISEIEYKINNQTYNNPNGKLNKTLLNDIHLIEFVPEFIKLTLNDSKPYLSFFKYKFLKGFMCNLSSTKTVEDYMLTQFSKTERKKVVTRLKRLETCFDIDYKTYYGNITKKEYDKMIEKLYSMIERRFAQKGETHVNFKNWDFYKENAYEMILDKKACLSVITRDNEPISISLDYLFEDIREGCMSSYEIDYSKFGLGNINILKKLEWCIDNGFSRLNMRYGDYAYKRYWCNVVYDYESYIVYKKSSLSKTIKALLIKKTKTMFAYMVMNKERFVFLIRLRNYFLKKEKHNKHFNISTNYTFTELQSQNNLSNKKRVVIDIKNDEYSFLRKLVYDFQYLYSVNYKHLKVYQIKENNIEIFCLESDSITKYFSLRKNLEN